MNEEVDLFSLCQDMKTELIAGIVFVFFCLLVFVVGGVLATGVTLGLISSVGFSILFVKARDATPGAYKFMVNHPFLTDAVTTGLGYLIFGLSVNGMIAAATFSIINTVVLMLASKYDPVTKESYDSAPLHKVGEFFQKFRNRNVIDVTAVQEGEENAA